MIQRSATADLLPYFKLDLCQNFGEDDRDAALPRPQAHLVPMDRNSAPAP